MRYIDININCLRRVVGHLLLIAVALFAKTLFINMAVRIYICKSVIP
jgi:hypothetical protein